MICDFVLFSHREHFPAKSFDDPSSQSYRGRITLNGPWHSTQGWGSNRSTNVIKGCTEATAALFFRNGLQFVAR